ncbi:MAG: response regulator [Verrucomicrobia bacterium]|nr:response regulator [Verrucomicrobiota bacterium]
MSHSPANTGFTLQGNRETVLLMEDDEHLHATLVRTFERLNYHVLPASNSNEGLRHWTAHRDTIRVVVSDNELGGMCDGWTLVRQFSEEKPGVVAILASGSLTRSQIDMMHRTTSIRCLPKPYGLYDLFSLIREGLKKGAPGG